MARLSLGELESELLGLAEHIAAAQCRFLRLLAEFDRRDGWAGPGLRSCAHWLSWKAGMSLRTAAGQVRVAHALEKLPQVTAAFAAGRISYSKVRAITRVTADLPDEQPTEQPDQPEQPEQPDRPNVADQPDAGSATPVADPASEADAGMGAGNDPSGGPGRSGPRWAPVAEVERTLLQVALGGTASHLETVVRAVRRRTAHPAQAQATRSLSWSWADDGCLVVRGRLAPAEGATLVAAIEALTAATATQPRTRSGPGPGGRPPDWAHRAVEHAPGAAADRVGARRADALLTLINTATDPEPAVHPAGCWRRRGPASPRPPRRSPPPRPPRPARQARAARHRRTAPAPRRRAPARGRRCAGAAAGTRDRPR